MHSVAATKNIHTWDGNNTAAASLRRRLEPAMGARAGEGGCYSVGEFDGTYSKYYILILAVLRRDMDEPFPEVRCTREYSRREKFHAFGNISDLQAGRRFLLTIAGRDPSENPSHVPSIHSRSRAHELGRIFSPRGSKCSLVPSREDEPHTIILCVDDCIPPSHFTRLAPPSPSVSSSYSTHARATPELLTLEGFSAVSLVSYDLEGWFL